MNDTVLEAIRGDHNYFNVDLNAPTDVDAGDTVTFHAGPTQATIAQITKTRGAGVVDLDLPNGKVQVQLQPADTLALIDDALLFEVILHKADVNMDTTVAKGVIRLTS